MVKIKKIQRDGSFRRLVRQLFFSWMMRQNYVGEEDFKQVFEKLEDIQHSIEIIARHMAKEPRRNE